MYQLWLDDLYPRAKFADGLAMIEKLGHSKRMKIMRQEWINEGKPRQWSPEVEDRPTRDDHTTPTRTVTAIQSVPALGENDDAAMEALRLERSKRADPGGDHGLFMTDDEAEDEVVEPPEDELDALLAEDVTVQSDAPEVRTALASQAAMPEKDEFADDEEAMAGFDDMW